MPGVQRRRVRNITDIEIRNETQHALLFLVPDLFLRQFDRREFDAHFGHFGRQRQRDLREDKVFSGMQDTGSSLRRETLRRNRKLERPGSDVCKRILPSVAGLRFRVGGLPLPGQLHPGAGNTGSIWVDDGSVDGSRDW